MVEPTGVDPRMDISIPIKVQHTEIIAEHMTTPLKLLITLIADNAGKITSAEINNEPTKFIASTIITAVITAISKLYTPVFIPVALAKLSSNIIANIRL